jgi:primosomal protein N' (replication factor Y)
MAPVPATPAREAAARAPVYAEVALVPALPGKDLLTYDVPEAQRARARPGVRVIVPLGRRRETGLIVALVDTPPAGVRALRSLEEILDAEPILTPELFALCRWAADYYCTTLADVLAAALPGGLRAATARTIRLGAPEVAARGPVEAAIVAELGTRETTTLRRLAHVVGERGLARALRGLAERGAIVLEEHVRPPAAKARLRTVFALDESRAGEAASPGPRARRQQALYARLCASPERRLDAAALSRPDRAAAEALARRGLVTRIVVEHYRDVRPSPGTDPRNAPVLTPEQAVAVDTIAGTRGFRTFLLHGVTGSGKTEVYLQLAARVRDAGRSALLLVPEIALTHQLVLRAQERFGSAVALLHSGLTPSERWDEWRRVMRGEARIVVGARSAVFAPVADLGLVVVDEEHDAAYKQDEGLRYNARDLALVRAKLAGTSAILGSATPSVESYQQALDGKFGLLSLSRRVAGRPLPEVTLVDLRSDPAAPAASATTLRAPRRGARAAPAERAAGTAHPQSTLFSPPLLAAIAATLARREQVLLFLNRRGFATTVQCLACGEPAGCPSCSVTLTLHERRRVLLCHHCGYARDAAAACARCRSRDVRALGDGTERVESEIAHRFPGARVGRLDRDTTASKGAHQRILDAWRAGTLDVLVGTQMVAKGHDVPAVTLVGVLLADVALGMPDFRAAERAFQLLTQVAGRAGRGDAPGRVLVQTYRPEHHSLVAAAAHDYANFAPRELTLRRELGYPPFARLAILRLEGVDSGATEAAAGDLAKRARAAAGGAAVLVRGPAPAPLERLRGRYRWQVLLSSVSARALHAVIRLLVSGSQSRLRGRAIRLVVDIDPISML